MWTHQPVLVLEDLHWLPVSQRVVFKMALMVWKCVHGVASAYLSNLCIPATAISGCQHHLRSAATGTPLVPRTQTATGQPSFAVNGPGTWNRLPPALWSLDLSEIAFKRALKTQLFSTARCRHDSDAGYKYPDLLSYSTNPSNHPHLCMSRSYFTSFLTNNNMINEKLTVQKLDIKVCSMWTAIQVRGRDTHTCVSCSGIFVWYQQHAGNFWEARLQRVLLVILY